MSDKPEKTEAAMQNVLTIGDLVTGVFRRIWVLLAVGVLVSVLTVWYALSLPDTYRAYAILAPADSDRGGGGLASLASQYGGLAGLAGINLTGSGGDRSALALEKLSSRQFLTNFIIEHDILDEILGAERWHRETNQLVYNPEIYDETNQAWVRKPVPPRGVVPSSLEGYGAFLELLSVVTDAETGFITVSVDHVSPILAKQWVDLLVHDLNRAIVTQDLREAEESIKYLEGKLNETMVASLRDVIGRLIEEQIKVAMLANVSQEYALQTVDPAIVPELKYAPKRAFLVLAIVFIVMALFTSALLAYDVMRGNISRSHAASGGADE